MEENLKLVERQLASSVQEVHTLQLYKVTLLLLVGIDVPVYGILAAML